MQRWEAVIARLFVLVLRSTAAVGALSVLATGQLQRDREVATLRQIVAGLVVMPDGSPAAGAVVVTSAGGKAVAGVDGGFTLEVTLPLDAESLEVTASREDGDLGTLSAGTSIPVTLSTSTLIETLVLAPPSACYSGWVPTFGEAPGTNGLVRALGVFDAGTGPALYAGGDFSAAGNVTAEDVARWNGSSWSALGAGFEDGTQGFSSHLNALAVHDDGSGPALYVAGGFRGVNGVTAINIAKWDGSGWSAVGSGLDNGVVYALCVHDDGSGPALFAGGTFTFSGSVSTFKIARWNGQSWSALGSGMTAGVTALASYDDGSGSALYAGGSFTIAGGVPANAIAKWDGSSWSALGAGTNSTVQALTVYDDGGGPALYVGGSFSTAGGMPASRIARWDGSSWSALGTGVNAAVSALTVHDDGSGPALLAGGDFTTAGGAPANRVAKWDGASWSALASGLSSSTVAVLTSHAGALFAGGAFTASGGTGVSHVAEWNGSSWEALGGGGLDARVSALLAHDDGSGPALYAAGEFLSAGGVSMHDVGKWDGSHWSALGTGMNASVRDLVVFDDGSGPALYAGGSFTSAGGTSANRVARWRNSSWSALGSGIGTSADEYVASLAVFDDGSGPALYAGGAFTQAGGTSANRIARWNGSSWSALGSGLGSTIVIPQVLALAEYDDGGGPALYVGGGFTTAGGVPANRIAKWDGASWSALGAGTNNTVFALTVHDDGGGPALYVGGLFSTAGGVAAGKIARWDGTSWSAVGAGIAGPLTYVAALTVHDDDGRGPELYAGGQFSRRVIKWDGTNWSTVGLGIGDTVWALASWDDGLGQALYAGGEFATSPAGDSYLAKWGCRPKTTVAKRRL